MYNQMKNIISWAKVQLNDRLGQRGAEMVEYAIVLACIAAVAAVFYTTTGKTDASDANSANTLYGALDYLWNQVKAKITPASGN